jgi:hypothetical protein
MPKQLGRAPYVTVAICDGLPPVEQAVPLEQEHLVLALRQQPGQRGMYVFRSEAAPARWIGAGVFDGPDVAAEADEHLRAFIQSTPMGAIARPLRHRGGQALVAEMA